MCVFLKFKFLKLKDTLNKSYGRQFKKWFKFQNLKGGGHIEWKAYFHEKNIKVYKKGVGESITIGPRFWRRVQIDLSTSLLPRWTSFLASLAGIGCQRGLPR